MRANPVHLQITDLHSLANLVRQVMVVTLNGDKKSFSLEQDAFKYFSIRKSLHSVE